ncbi:MAG: murein transglycosylase [Bacteroidetes bacterium]|nr:MAG: murein transglycosylase [Bacteroidota bacterium]
MHNRNAGRSRLFIYLFLFGALIAVPFMFFGIGELWSGGREGSGEDRAMVSYMPQKLPIPADVNFAGEPVPIDLFDVREALERELLSNAYFHSQTIRLLKLSNRFFPEIESILKQNLVPDDFKYLAVAESNLSQAVSPAKAVGFWQLMKGTAIDYGLEVDAEVDERYHIGKSTEVACKYLIESYQRYGNWTMTAASYNMGRRGIDRQIDRQKKMNYYDLLLNPETARYIYRVVALKLIFENPEAYGFQLAEEELYPVIPVKVLKVDTTVTHFADFAALHGTNYKLLKYLNPWLRDVKLSNSRRKSYEILVPANDFRRPNAWEEK